MHSLNLLDYVIILSYLGLSLVMGLVMSRRASSSMDHYFLGGRSVPWYLLGVMGMANWFDLTGTMLITSFLYMLGPRGLFIEFRGGAVLILAFMLVYTGKWHRRSGCMTGAEWGIYRFGNNAVARSMRVFGAVMTIITTIMMLAYLVRGASLFLGMFFPYPPMYTTLALVVLIPFVGPAAWLLAGRPVDGRDRTAARSGVRRTRASGPDDDPEFLAALARSNRQRERERRQREPKDRPPDEPAAPA